MTTIRVPYVCTACNHQFDLVMKAGEPIISTKCPKCGSLAKSTYPSYDEIC